ncbi:autoinducer binding domain-containing protein [Pseudomonas sp. 148P]|uniref:Autoinducer binding domain-containing protein n=1 Tax=Pseudomonas ulcerans TaxID=3115852 RepID=A0ABU7HQ15_9PSED|nr:MULTISPECIES: autoinducer binding domain-containing protein [unclassified Pseudomonas]MEE1922638.1 autoinducer binding domain-containing protein [Pseudomonas sp. 147P]MEE1933615.1 autoinducer binding domain-containing protein [Pseudomonas sp. 148P]
MPFSADVLNVLAREVSPTLRFAALHDLVVQLGFDFFGFSCWTSFDPRPLLRSTWPEGWTQRYKACRYSESDPRITHCRRSILPIFWDESCFQDAPDIWQDARSFGLCHGWSQGSHSERVFSMLDVARRDGPISNEEWYEKAGQVLLLCNLMHMNQVDQLQRKIDDLHLTCREIEVLRWSAIGKTAEEVADILHLSESTVNFHARNTIVKLGVQNKVAAIARAAQLGLFSTRESRTSEEPSEYSRRLSDWALAAG